MFYKLVAFLILLLAAPAWGANCGGEVACSCGDTITSNYTLSANLDCSSGSAALIVGADSLTINGNTKILSNSGTTSTGILSTDRDNIVITGFVITGFAANGILLDGGLNNQITGNTIYANESFGISIRGDATYPANSNIVDNNTIYSNKLSGVVLNDDDGALVVAANLNNNVIRNNIAYHNGSNIYIQRSLDTLVYQNTLHDAYTTDSGEGYGIAVTSSPRTKVYQNTIYSNATGGVEVWGDTTIDPNFGEGHNCEVYSNYIYDHNGTDDYGIAFRTDEVDGLRIRSNILYNNYAGLHIGGVSTDVLIANNTVVGGTIGLVILDNINTPAGNSATGTSVKNNIFLNASTYALLDSTAVGTAALAAHTNNVYFFTCVQYSNWLIDYAGTSYSCMENANNFEATAVASDPLLNASYGLAGNSPAKDAGAVLYTYAAHPGDFIGAKVHGSAPDIGAFEYQDHTFGGWFFEMFIPTIFNLCASTNANCYTQP